MTELAGMRSFDNLNKTGIILSSSEAKDMEAAMRSIVEVTCWMDWWMFAMKSLALKSTSDARASCPSPQPGCRQMPSCGKNGLYLLGPILF